MSIKDLKCELLDFFDMDKNMPTVSAFVQQRNKISVTAFETLFHKFTESFPQQKLYKGYRRLLLMVLIYIPQQIHRKTAVITLVQMEKKHTIWRVLTNKKASNFAFPANIRCFFFFSRFLT